MKNDMHIDIRCQTLAVAAAVESGAETVARATT
jgi:hypothetical protein